MHKPLALVTLTVALSAQAEWTQLMPAAMPSARTEVQMVSDGTAAFLFAGLNGPTATAFADLWRFDGANWVQQMPAASPPARSRFAMGYDFGRGAILVFGGDAQYAGGGSLGDTWEYDIASGSWTQQMPVNAPSPRIHARLAFDIPNTKMLLFGGRGAGGGETWHWDATQSPPNWTLLLPNNSPPAREQIQMATDWSTARIVGFGGSTSAGNSGILGDTWTWDGFDWTQQSPATTPGFAGIRNGKMTYDFLRQRIVLFGGVPSGGGFSDRVWEYDGVDWTERFPPISPAGRAGLGWCYVQSLGTSVAFAGYNGGFFNDTWTWQTNAPATVAMSGTGCPTTAGDPTLSVSAPPWNGDTVDLTIGNVPPGGLQFLVWSLDPTTTSLAGAGYPGCAAVSQIAVQFTLGPVPFSVPTTAANAGVQLSAQGAVLEPMGQALGLGLTDVTTLTIGVR